jgi:hypothetical protein
MSSQHEARFRGGRNIASAGVVRRDEIEPLGEAFDGFWISNPAGVINLVAKPDQSGY